MKPFIRLLGIMAFVICAAGTALTQWSSDPEHNNPVCTAYNAQHDPKICSDGHGGAIITWWDLRNDAGNIYAQRIDSTGTALWRSNGVPVCSLANKQSVPSIISDNRGGAIIVWSDERTGQYSGNIYAQRVDADGNFIWPANGALIHNPVAYEPVITSDGGAGAIIAWRDDRPGSVDVADIYAQHIDSSGTLTWAPATGVPICTSAGQQLSPNIIPDELGGAIVLWRYTLGNGTPTIYSQRVNASGAVQWTTNGVAVATTYSQAPVIRPDGNHGCYVIWEDGRSPTGNWQVYGQHIGASGTMQWTANGKAFTPVSRNVTGYNFVPVAGGDLLLAYSYYGSGSNVAMLGQRVFANGQVAWDSNGVTLSNARWEKYAPKMIPDGSGGAIVVWYDDRLRDTMTYYSQYDIYGQRFDTTGQVLWSQDGCGICCAAQNQLVPCITANGTGGAIVAWEDNRDGGVYAGTNDIYASRLNLNGTMTGIREATSRPAAFVLREIYPNPFNGCTSLRYTIHEASRLRISVHDLLGRRVAVLADNLEMPGEHTVAWDAAQHATGVYFLRFEVLPMSDQGSVMILTRKMVMLR